MFANIKLAEEYVLDPFLKELVDKLALKYSAYTFTYEASREDGLGGFTHTLRGNVPPPEGKRFLRKINVKAGTELLGTIGILNVYRGYKNFQAYELSSWRVAEKMQRRNSTVTTKLDAAMRAVKQHFVPQNYEEFMSKADDAADNARYVSINDLIRPITSNSMTPGTVEMQTFAYKTMCGQEVGSQLTEIMRRAFLSDWYHKAMSEYLLGLAMSGNRKYVTIAVRDGGYMMRELEDRSSIRCYEFEELPIDIQSKLAVLQLMQDDELVLDVGFKVHSDLFSIVI